MTSKRVSVYHTRLKTNKILVNVNEHLDDFLCQLSQLFSCDIHAIQSPSGCVIRDITVIRDADELCAVTEEDLADLCEHRVNMSDTDWVTLNVGGQIFATTRSTLVTREPESMLARMFSQQGGVRWSSTVDQSGAYLIDRSSHYFEPILNYLRHGRIILDKDMNIAGVVEEAQFYGLQALCDLLGDFSQGSGYHGNCKDYPLKRRDLTLRLLSVPTNTELRCQGLDFTDADLSKLDLRCINFKYAIMRNTNLSGANLAHCNFERSIMHKAILDGANLLGVKMLCVNLESASLKGCNFEDPAGSRANMEGAQMKYVNLEGSHMASVNLRVATLKNTNLKNCDLRGAVLAGADLENCILSGCDLQDANLRGANLKGAAFELMLNALHMSQTV